MGDFDDEAEDREQNLVFKLIDSFVDESSIAHNLYPETESDSEEEIEEEGVPLGRQQTRLRLDDESFEGEEGRAYSGLVKDQMFFNGVAFKEAVLAYALKTGRNLRQYRHDKDKIGFVCVDGGSASDGEECAWQIYASTLSKDPMWRVRKLVDSHTCVPNGRCEVFKVPAIARLFVDKITEEPSYYTPMKMEEIVFAKWCIVVSRPQYQAARNMTMKWIEFEHDHQFSRFRDYVAELLDSNKDSTVAVECLQNGEGQDVFHRFYVCFDVLSLLLALNSIPRPSKDITCVRIHLYFSFPKNFTTQFDEIFFHSLAIRVHLRRLIWGFNHLMQVEYGYAGRSSTRV